MPPRWVPAAEPMQQDPQPMDEEQQQRDATHEAWHQKYETQCRRREAAEEYLYVAASSSQARGGSQYTYEYQFVPTQPPPHFI